LTISPEISGALHSLKSLIIYDCSHAELEELFGELTSLEELTIRDHEKLEELPNNMRHLTKLQSLSLRWCPSLRQLPQWLGQLKSLKTLQVDVCHAIMTLPESIEELTNLQELNIISWSPELKRWCNAEENKTKLAHIEHKVCALPYCLSYIFIAPSFARRAFPMLCSTTSSFYVLCFLQDFSSRNVIFSCPSHHNSSLFP
jgi:hypothetical protein